MQAPPILDHTATLADLTRCRLLRILGRQELMVGELCTVLQLPQSTVSRHLKLLVDGGWLQVRRQGTSHLYRLDLDRMDDGAARLWALVATQLAGHPIDAEDARRLSSVLVDRRSRSQAFFSSTADRWDALRTELFGNRFDVTAAAGLLDPEWRVGDLACGTGQLAAALAPFVGRVEAIDGSAAMLAAARERLGSVDNVRIREGELERLPLDDGSLDAVALVLALHYVPEPEVALREVRRVLVPGGRFLLVDMTPHDREAFRQEMGHVWLGFAADDVTRLMRDAGLVEARYHVLPADPAAKGPSLFVATATVPVRPARAKTPTNARVTAQNAPDPARHPVLVD